MSLINWIVNRTPWGEASKNTITFLFRTNSPRGGMWKNLSKADQNEIASVASIAEVAEYVDFICDTIASLQIKLYKKTDHGIVEVKGDLRVTALNVGTDNANMDGYQFKKAMVRDYLLVGEGYAYIHKVGNVFSGLYYVPSNMVWARENKNYNTLTNRSYTLVLNPLSPFGDEIQQKGEFDARNFLKFLRHSHNGVEGQGIVFELKQLFETMNKESRGLMDAISNPGVRSGICKLQTTLPQNTKDDQISKIKEALADANLGNVGVVDSDVAMEWIDDPDFYEVLATRCTELHQRLRRLFKLDSSFEERIQENVIPVVKAFEAMLNFSLLKYDDWENYFFEFDTDELFNVDPQKRLNRYKISLDAGFKTRNEIRNAEKIGEKEGLDLIQCDLGKVMINGNKVIVPNTGTTIDVSTGEVNNNGQGKNPTVERPGGITD